MMGVLVILEYPENNVRFPFTYIFSSAGHVWLVGDKTTGHFTSFIESINTFRLLSPVVMSNYNNLFVLLAVTLQRQTVQLLKINRE